MITLYRTDKSIIGEFQVDSVKEAVEFAVKQGISLANVNLEGANLVGANLKWVDFEGANLAFASLEDVSLEFANLIEASLEGANLKGANFKWASLNGVNFAWADLVGADLVGADLKGANFTGAYFDFAAISLQCKSTEAIVDDRFAAQLAHLLTRQDYSNCSEEVKRDIDIIKSLPITNLLAKYRNDIKLI